jgi:hypothetical protein
MHGGTYVSGNLEGPANSNYRHGRYTPERMAEMRKVRAILKMSNEQILALLAVPAEKTLPRIWRRRTCV